MNINLDDLSGETNEGIKGTTSGGRWELRLQDGRVLLANGGHDGGKSGKKWYLGLDTSGGGLADSIFLSHAHSDHKQEVGNFLAKYRAWNNFSGLCFDLGQYNPAKTNREIVQLPKEKRALRIWGSQEALLLLQRSYAKRGTFKHLVRGDEKNQSNREFVEVNDDEDDERDDCDGDGDVGDMDEGNEPVLMLSRTGHSVDSTGLLLQNESNDNRPTDGCKFLYTGDFITDPGGLFPPLSPRPTDVLYCECTFGHPKHVFPPLKEIKDHLLDWTEEQVTGSGVIIYGYPLGKNQEIVSALSGVSSDIKIIVDEETYFVNQLCEAVEGIELPPHHSYAEFSRKRKFWREEDFVLVLPIHQRFNKRFQKFEYLCCKRAICSGWVSDTKWVESMKVDEAFPLSGHPDFPSLLSFIERCQPRALLLGHGNGTWVRHEVQAAREKAFSDGISRDIRVYPLTR